MVKWLGEKTELSTIDRGSTVVVSQQDILYVANIQPKQSRRYAWATSNGIRSLSPS